MNSEKILYWVALGAMVVGMSHEYRDGKFPAAHRLVANAESTLCPVVARAERTLAMAKFILNPPAALTTDEVTLSAANLSQEQAEMLRDRAEEQAEMARAQAELVRDQARDQAEMIRDQVQAQAEMLRSQAEMRRTHFEQFRHFARSQFRFSSAADRHIELVCPTTGKKIFVKVETPEAPEVEVSDDF
jgi:hypothetical protein